MKQRLLIGFLGVSVLVLGTALYLLISKIGGLRYTWYRYKTNDAGTQLMRAEHFAQLPPADTTDARLRVILVGDSQVQFAEWAELLEVGGVANVYNRGISGDHVEGVRARLGSVVALRPHMVFVWVGVNDLFFGRSPEEVAEMYRGLLADIKRELPLTQIVVCTLAPVQTRVRHLPMVSEPIKQFNAKLRGISQEYACKLLDTSAVLSDQFGDLKEEFTRDGVHLTHAAYTLIKQQMEPLIRAQAEHGIQ